MKTSPETQHEIASLRPSPNGNIPRRRGLSFIELLVVIGIITLFMALTVPAVQWSRERSRAAAYQNNLKQLGTALVNFHSQFGYLPKDGRNGFGYGAFMLRQLEQSVLYKQVKPMRSPLTGPSQARDRGGATARLPLPFLPRPAAGGISWAVPLQLSRLGWRLLEKYATPEHPQWPEPHDRPRRDDPRRLGQCGERDRALAISAANMTRGLIFLFCEGSVWFIEDSVDAKAFRRC